jgi:general secretion pathway protein L
LAGKNQFEVFGVDVRDYGQLWLAAWRDFLFGDDSPIRTALDSKVILKHADGTSACYQASRQVTDGSASAEAYAISDDLVLSRTLTLPSIAEADLEAALQLEVSACSVAVRISTCLQSIWSLPHAPLLWVFWGSIST